MELLFYPLILSFVVLLLILKTISSVSRKPKPKRIPLPPGPSQLPVIGSIHHLLGSVPHRRLRDLALVHGPIMHLKLGQISTIVVSSAEAAREIMKTHDINFATRPLLAAAEIISYGGRSLIFAPYGHFWRQLRKICVLELLSAKRVGSFKSIREDEVLGLISSISSLSPSTVNLSKKLDSLANDITMRAVIGDKCKDQASFLTTLNQTVELGGGFDLADLFPSSPAWLGLISGTRAKLRKCHQELDRILNTVIEEHRESKKKRAVTMTGDGVCQAAGDEDLLDVLVKVQEDDNLQFTLSDENIKAVVLDLFAAGSETSATVLGWAMTELMRNPRVMKKAQSEIRDKPMNETNMDQLKYLKLVIKETLRLHTPVPLLIPRECQETCEVLGYEIPAKARLVVNAWAIARDPQYWGEDSEEFKPERFEGIDVDFKGTNFEYIPFGAGRRMCPGMSFGLATVELPLARLLYHFNWELPGGEDLDMGETLGATARRKTDLCLRAIPILPCK